MRALIIGAAAAALASGAAFAQTQTNLSGTWVFHTANYAPSEGISLTMSGAATLRRASGGRYNVELFTQEVATRGQEYQEHWARQRCEGRVSGEELTITCMVRESDAEGYQPDNFQLTRQADGSLLGHLVSSSSAEAVFRKVR